LASCYPHLPHALATLASPHASCPPQHPGDPPPQQKLAHPHYPRNMTRSILNFNNNLQPRPRNHALPSVHTTPSPSQTRTRLPDAPPISQFLHCNTRSPTPSDLPPKRSNIKLLSERWRFILREHREQLGCPLELQQLHNSHKFSAGLVLGRKGPFCGDSSSLRLLQLIHPTYELL